MESRKTLLLLTFCILSLQLLGQSLEIQARSNYLKAQELFENGEHKEAIVHLNTAKALLKSTNPRIEYLLAKSHLEGNQVIEAERSMKKYFELAAESDQNYTEMLLFIDDLNEQKKIIAAKEASIAREKSNWEEALTANTPESFKRYVTAYPEGMYLSEARSKIRSFPVEPPIEPSSGRVYKIVRIGDQYWMAENLISDGSEFIPFSDKLSACPDGWRLPSNEDYDEMLKVIEEKIMASKPIDLNGNSGLIYYYSSLPFDALALSDGKKWQASNSLSFNATPILSKGGSPFSQQPNTANYWTVDGYFTLSPTFAAVAILYRGYNGPSLKAMMPCRCVKF